MAELLWFWDTDLCQVCGTWCITRPALFWGPAAGTFRASCLGTENGAPSQSLLPVTQLVLCPLTALLQPRVENSGSHRLLSLEESEHTRSIPLRGLVTLLTYRPHRPHRRRTPRNPTVVMADIPPATQLTEKYHSSLGSKK